MKARPFERLALGYSLGNVMKGAPFGGTFWLSPRSAWKEASCIMLHVGLDLSRKRVDVGLISEEGGARRQLAAPSMGRVGVV